MNAFVINEYVKYVQIPRKYDKFLFRTPKNVTAVGWGSTNADTRNMVSEQKVNFIFNYLICILIIIFFFFHVSDL